MVHVDVRREVPLAVAEGEPIPLLGFPQATAMGAVLGVLLTKLCRSCRHPRGTFVRVATALVAVSMVPSLVIDTDTASKIALVVSHIVVAVILIPVLASTLAAGRHRVD